MLFNSYVFVCIFLPVVLLLWWSKRFTVASRLGMLTVASYLFYGWWDFRFVGLLLVSTVVDFHAGKQIFSSNSLGRRRLWLLLSLGTNLGLLAFFKYSGFFAESWNGLADWLRSGGTLPVPEIVLPIGISFYTFQTLSYSIDIYRRDARPAESIWHFAAYVSLFPQLIAGPIVRYSQLDSQLRYLCNAVNWTLFARGIFFFVTGMAQKVLLADTIASKTDPLLADHASLQFIASWYAMLGYTCQLYFDFAGYSNMAVGLGMMLGFSFPQNFDSPYKSENISEFWRRWHMTLSCWLRDYLFVPLGGSRLGRWLTLRNLVIVMFLGGLWHGAGWTFVLWGLFHGVLLVVHSIFRESSSLRLARPAAVAITFLSVLFGWVLFRSTDMQMCGSLVSAMAGLRGVESELLSTIGGAHGIAILGILLAIVFLAPNVWQIKFQPTIGYALALSFVFVVCVLRFDSESPFLYFQF